MSNKKKKIKLVIFDLDGTLIDAYQAITESFNFTMHKLKYPLQKSTTIKRSVGWGDRNLLKPFVRDLDLDRALTIYRRHHQISLLKWSKLLPGAENILTYLRTQGYKLAIATNRPTKFTLILLRHLKIRKYFQYVLCADKLDNIKPHPQILEKIIQRFKLRPEEVIFVGDMVIDAQTARRAKVKAILIPTGSNTKQQLEEEKAAYVIKNLNFLSRIL